MYNCFLSVTPVEMGARRTGSFVLFCSWPNPKHLGQGLAHSRYSVTRANIRALTPGRFRPERKQNASLGSNLPFKAEKSTAGWLGVWDKSDTARALRPSLGPWLAACQLRHAPGSGGGRPFVNSQRAVSRGRSRSERQPRPINPTSDSFMGLGVSMREMPRGMGSESPRAKPMQAEMLSHLNLHSCHFAGWPSSHWTSQPGGCCLYDVDEAVTAKRKPGPAWGHGVGWGGGGREAKSGRKLGSLPLCHCPFSSSPGFVGQGAGKQCGP